MNNSFDRFRADCHAVLKANSGFGGREAVRKSHENLPKDLTFVAAKCN